MRNLLIGIALAFGCGGDENSCETVNQRICDLACDCTAGSECKLSTGPATATHNNAADCRAFQVTFGCSQETTVDFEMCNAALDTATCANDALQLPAVCGFGF
ncbi:MAG: hypothetical protein AB7P03_03605 [Kofleriaceae bacterium]